ncbi:hypothetical protein [Lysobacter gummosus]
MRTSGSMEWGLVRSWRWFGCGMNQLVFSPLSRCAGEGFTRSINSCD